ncbi:MAG TPA: polysaccharide deacetylase family protein [Chitinophagaceae bacterium]|nr:polysaccharide deacetylase family protein [Chitinophagaceae bacterium]
MSKDKKILLSFDVEEFDLPMEYKQKISIEEQLEVGYKGLVELEAITNNLNAQFTLFTTAFFADHFPDNIKTLSRQHEIASHTYFHSTFKEEDLKTSKEKLETIIGKPIYGLRMPRMKFVNADVISQAGYQYNSSINPTWVPGRYNNLHLPRTIFSENGLMQLPVSVTPHFRIPLFWLAFKNMPYSIFLKMALQTLRHDGYVCLYFHPWEFIDLSNYKLPFYIKTDSKKLFQKLNRLIGHLSCEGEFTAIHSFIKSKELQPVLN